VVGACIDFAGLVAAADIDSRDIEYCDALICCLKQRQERSYLWECMMIFKILQSLSLHVLVMQVGMVV
jgi:hypothetical protein